jgi:hypothetical protein
MLLYILLKHGYQLLYYLLSAVNYRNKNSIKGSIHKARKDLVREKTDRKTYRSYQQLYTMSMQARYLMNNGEITAYDYFNESDARRAVNEFLVNIISYFGFEDTQDDFAISDIIN